MSGITLDLPGGQIPLRDVCISRALGESVRFRFVAAIQPDAWQDRERIPPSVQKALLSGPCRVKVTWEGTSSAELASDATIVGARWRNEDPLERHADIDRPLGAHYLELEATDTSPERRPNVFAPRRRVHRVKNVKELLARLDHVAKPLGALQGELERLTFPDGDKASIVQDGVSDWTFLFQVLGQCDLLAAHDATWLPLTLVGGSNKSADTKGRWIVLPGSIEAYRSWGTVGQRTLRLDESAEADGASEIDFGGLPRGERVPSFPSGELPCVIDRRSHRKFDAGRWNEWRSLDLPRFDSNGAMVWRIDDRIYAGGGSGIGWKSEIFTGPPETSIVGPEPHGQLQPWIGLGKVEKTSREGPWVMVRLPGFESGDDLINVRIGTPYSGKNGRRGLHMVPEDSTEVTVAWTGRFDQSILLWGNARSEAAEHPSPSTYLEAEHTAQYADIHVVKIGNTNVDSALAVNVKQRTDLTSTQKLEVKADGADLKMSGGTVYTGRGF